MDYRQEFEQAFAEHVTRPGADKLLEWLTTPALDVYKRQGRRRALRLFPFRGPAEGRARRCRCRA